MNAAIHAKLSCNRAKTTSEKDFNWFYEIHNFMDSSKEVESSNLHRICFHSIFSIKRVIIPIFGHSYTCENGKVVNIKDDMEQHLLEDNRGKYIASLSDYVSLIKDNPNDQGVFDSVLRDNRDLLKERPEIKELLLSPYKNTGEIKAMWVTMNVWFTQTILPEIYKGVELIINDPKALAPSIMFNRMTYADWVQNGAGHPPSFEKINKYRKSKEIKTIAADIASLPFKKVSEGYRPTESID